MQTLQDITICLDLNNHGRWDVSVPGESRHIECASLPDARATAYEWAAARRPCQLIVRDAYHRVLAHEVLDRP